MTFILLDDSAPGQVISRQPQGAATQEQPLRDLLFEHPELRFLRNGEMTISGGGDHYEGGNRSTAVELCVRTSFGLGHVHAFQK